MLSGKRITSIVSVFNEEKTVKNVIASLLNCELIDEIIVVNDGSTDGTSKILNQLFESHKFRYVKFDKNKGKSYAMIVGVENSTGEIIVFVDADIIGLNCEHIEKLIFPLVSNQADMVIGYRLSEKSPKVDITGPIDVWLGGERACYKKDILPILNRMSKTKYGAETFLNLYYKSKNKKIKIVKLDGLIHLKKYEKYRLDTAALNYTKASLQIVSTVAINYFLVFDVVKNIFKMSIFRLVKWL